MHTGWKSRGGGTWCFLPKSLGGSRVSGKIAWGGPPISGFIAFLLTSVLKFAWGGYYIYPPPFPPPHPPCVHLRSWPYSTNVVNEPEKENLSCLTMYKKLGLLPWFGSIYVKIFYFFKEETETTWKYNFFKTLILVEYNCTEFHLPKSAVIG